MTSIVYTNQRSKKRKKMTAKDKQLQQDWEKLMAKWAAKPNIEKGNQREHLEGYLDRSGDRGRNNIPSLDTGMGVAPAKPSPTYTGTEMIGIGQLHKSNAVPVFRTEDAEDLARMRR